MTYLHIFLIYQKKNLSNIISERLLKAIPRNPAAHSY